MCLYSHSHRFCLSGSLCSFGTALCQQSEIFLGSSLFVGCCFWWLAVWGEMQQSPVICGVSASTMTRSQPSVISSQANCISTTNTSGCRTNQQIPVLWWTSNWLVNLIFCRVSFLCWKSDGKCGNIREHLQHVGAAELPTDSNKHTLQQSDSV